MTAAALSAYKFAASYGRYLPEAKRRETPSESFSRVIDMHRVKYAGIDIEDELAFCEAAMNDNLILGSQRALQFGGRPILRKNARIYNCTTSYCDRPRFFQECLYLLLCGCGTGFSVQTHHIAKLPKLIDPDKNQTRKFVIPDTVEGWADALGVLLASYGIVDDSMAEFGVEAAPGTDTDIVYQPEGVFKDYVGAFVSFDYSRIRDKGADLSTGAGKAPGPGPLMASLEHIRKVLDNRLKMANPGEKVYLRSIDAYDVIMHASDAVLAGGVRRSASICLFSPDDELMLNAKTGNWMQDNPQRGRSNNSAVLLRDSTSWEQFHNLFMTARKQFGEPGFVWADSTEITYNPCVEIGLYPQIKLSEILFNPPRLGLSPEEFEEIREHHIRTGVIDENDSLTPGNALHTISGWAFCNLCEINAKVCRTDSDWDRAAKAAALLGTMQAGYTDFSYLGPVSKAIANREALLGCSMTGMMDNPEQAFDPIRQRALAKLILDTNAKFAPRLGLNPTARATCVKPAGSTSCIFGTSSGIHAQHAKRYFRRAQANADEAPAKFFALRNPKAVEKSVWNSSGTDVVVTFCIEAADEALTRHEVGGVAQLEYVKSTQENWVNSGKVAERCARPWLRHNVSNTITVSPKEHEECCRYIYDNREAFAGISIADTSVDLDYPQAVFCEVRTEEELIERYGTGVFLASGLIVDGLHAFGENLWKACDTVLGLGEATILANGVEYPADPHKLPEKIRDAYRSVHQQKKDWVRRARQFAARYFGFDPKAESLIIETFETLTLEAEESLQRYNEATDAGYHDQAALVSERLGEITNQLAQATNQLEEVRKPLKRMTYCLKEVNNLKLWVDLTRDYKDVDYADMVEKTDGTRSVVLDAACAGASCSMEYV